MLKTYLLKKFALICGLFFLADLNSFPCDQTSINVLTAVDNGNGTFTYTVQICLGISPNWGGTDAITIDADVPIVNSGFTPSVSTTYTYCDVDLAFNGQNCTSGNVMGFPPAGGNMTTVTSTATGSVSGGNLTYNGTQDLAPGDVFAPAGDCGDCNNPNQLCFNVTFTTTGAMTTVQLNNAEQDNNNCGGGACCPDEIDNTIPAPSSGCTPPSAGFTSNSPECLGSSFSFTNTGAMTGVTWSWTFSGGTPATSTSQNPSGVTWSAAGNYNVTQTVCLTAQPTCCSNFSTNITVNAPPTLTTSPSATTCGLCNGSIDLNPSGGSAPYFYNWSNGSTIQDPSSLCSGSYTVTVTDNNGCTATATASVNASTGPTCGFTVSGSTCLSNNSFNFSNTGSMGGGVTYSWTFPSGTPATSTSSSPSGVTWSSAGTYTITQNVIQSGCTATCTQPITVLPNPTVSFSSTNETCAGLCNGSATATGAGTTSPYTYSWSGGLGTGASKSGLCAGTYIVTVTDANGCTGTGTVTINPGLVVTSTFTNSANQCLTGNSFNFTNTGTSGGGVTYSWTFPSGTPASSTSNNVTGVTWSSAGTYTITHTVIQSGCTSTTTGTITVYPMPSVTLTPTNPNCNTGCTGSISASGSGGTPGYTFTWSGGLGTGTSKSSLCAGTYTVTVTDASGCTGTASVTLTAPPALTVSASATNATCNGTCNGTLSASGSGGTSPYTYSWNGGLGSGATKSGVCTGTYTVTITDNKGCTATATATVNQPTAIVPSASATNATCNGTCNGTLTASASGGTSPYTYSWSGGLGSGATKSSVCAGTYTVTVTDANGCTATASATVNQPPVLTVTATPTSATCNGTCNGILSASASGGTTSYTYSWSGGLGSGATKSGVCAGTYTVTVTDANGCTATATTTVNQPAVLSVTATPTAATCNGTCNGTLTASAFGGTTSYTYSWTGGLGTGATKSSVCAGTYTVTVTDANGCTATATATVNQPTALSANATGTNLTCNTPCNGTLSATGSGGITGYTYSWSGGLGSGAIKTSVCAGTYTVTVTDANGCTTTASYTVTAPTALTATATPTAATCNGTCNGQLTASGSGGTSPYTYSWSGGLGSGATKTNVCAGTYTVTVTDANGCTTTANATVNQPTAVSGTVTPTAATCNGTCNGQLTASGSGGTSPYTYSWSGGLGSGATKTGVCAGTYTVTITDANGCTGTASGTVNQPAALSVTATPTAATCNGTCNGTLTASASGGTTSYTYSWSGGLGTGAIKSSVCAGTYTVTVTDANGCIATVSATVNQPTAISLTTSSTNATCGNSNGTGTVVATGGTSPYTYLWCNAQTTSTATGLAAGGCNVTVTDASGCTATAVATVNSVGGPTVTIPTSANVSCNGGNSGSATASVSGGTTPYTYSWSPSGGTAISATGLSAGTYTINVTDNNGCIASATVTITQPSTLLSSISSAINVTCTGLCNGSATVTASGGTTNYSYLWSNSQTTATATGLCSGSFTVTVTDANGCTSTSTATITQPASLTATATATAATCNGTCNGSINLTVSGGTTSYSYSWSNSSIIEDLTALCAGTYNVTVTDSKGCTATASATVNQPTALSLSTSTTNSTCGNANGTATITASGGTTGYTYLWQNAQTTTTATGLTAGSWTVTVTDANGCTATTTATVSNSGGPTVTIGSVVNVACFGGNNGSATANVSGGATPYTYLWSPSGGTGSVASGLSAGNYTVTVTDANGCPATASTTITQPGILGAVISSSTNITCNGLCNGSATVSASGGTSPYTYLWQSGGTSSTKTGMCAGAFVVTVSDANGCATTASVTITEPPILSSSISGTNTTCNGICNGAANLTVSGGTAPYTYNWSNSSTSEDLSSICAGTFTVTVTDANGCTSTSSVTINSPTAVSTTTSSTNSTCGNSNGSACVTASGGTTPYTYSWNTVPIQTTTCATGVAAGNYTVTVTDANGCTATASVIVSNSSGGTASATVISNATGAGLCNGSASASMTGGTSPYTYLWDNGQTTSTATGLCAGTVCVTVTDANGCSSVACVIITEPGAIITSTVVTDVTCNGTCDGSVDLTVSGGVSPYTYNWSSGATAQDPAGLCDGTYTVTVTDANGNTTTTSATVTQPTVLSVTGTQFNIACNGFCTGQINITASGGTSPYTYSWSNSSTNEDIASLCAGSYTVTVTDANSCTATSTFTITEPPTLALTTSSTNASCGSANGSASVSVSGGTSPYTYNWSAGSTGTTQSSVAAGSYTVTVADANGCTATATVSVSNNSTGTVTASVVNNISCNGGSDGSASASITGGTSPFTFSWSTTPAQSGTTATGLSAGNYTVSVTDNNGCIATANVNITQPSNVDVSASSTNATCNGVCDGTLDAVASGGTSPYTYNWSGGIGAGASQTGICAGTYTVTATDANGCTATSATTVTEPTAIILTTATLNSSCGQADGQASVTVTGGTSPYTYVWSNSSISSTVTGIPAGTYTVSVTDAAGCTVIATATVNDDAAPTATASVISQITCNGICDGSANVTVTGGTSPYSYLWNNGSTATSATGLCAGTASVNVTDATGCTASATVTLSEPTALSATASATDALCNGVCDGTLSASALGGTSPYTYSWSGGLGSGATISSVCAGTYTVTATDANGCTTTATATVNEPIALTATATATAALCNGVCNGTVSASGNGGTSPYSFSWSGGLGSGATINSVCVGSYSVTLTDNNGCIAAANTAVTEPAVLTATATATATSCNGICDGSVSASASGGTAGYTFTWSGGLPSGANNNNVCAGNYDVTVTDANGCTTTTSTTVTEPSALSITVSSTNVSCNGNCDGSATATVSGGTSPHSYLWNDVNFQTTSSATALCAGTFDVTVTDASGCTINGSATITQPSPLVLGNSTNGSTCNQSDGDATVTIVSGGVTPYSYQWSASAGNQTTATATGLAAGCYDVTVTNGNGCTQMANICVNDLGAPTVSLLSQTDASCFGSCDGFAQIAVSGGNPPYSYSWNTTPVQTTASAFNLCAGTYNGTMIDATGCMGSISVTITQPQAVSGIISAQTDASCFGNCDGSATVTASGGNSPYSYQWNDINSQTPSTATGLCPGNYSVIISDINSCDTTISVTINEPQPISLSINTTNAFCGTASGQACVTTTNGVSPFTYLWNNTQSTQCAGNLIPGNYSVTVTDFNGCTAGASATVNNTAPGTATISNVTDVSCNGLCNGSATVSMSGAGTTPYSYLWLNSDTGITADSLCAGNISVTVTDANGCASNVSATINAPVVLSATVSSTDAICFGVCSGNSVVAASGGTSPYSYLWNDVLAQTTSTATGLCAGNYSVTITDDNNCTTVQNAVISEPSALQLSATVFDAHCGQPDGNACVVVSGGTSPYTYQWNSGQTNQCLNNVIAGAYNITVTDANGCTATLGVNIQDLNGPAVNVISIVNATCSGSCDGSATISMSGGAGTYTINWYDNLGNPIFQTNPTAANLCAGNYSATVSDSAGCSASVSATISEPSAITYNQSTVDPTCSGNCSGSATASVTGGTSPYIYSWNDSQNQTTPTATGLCAGSYVLTIADSNNCTVFANFTLNNPTVMTATTSVVNTTCAGVCNGSATVTAFNGNAPFVYLWDASAGNQTTQTAINLCGGTFNVTVTDATGCSATTTATIGQPASVTAVVNTFGNVNCNGNCNGFAQVSVSGGTPGYVYSWSDGQINQVASNLCAGIYVVSVTDINGCSDTAQVTITQPQVLTAAANTTNVSCNGNCDGSSVLNVSGGTPSYTYLWSASAGFQNTISATGLCAGTHSVTITDANGCTKPVTVVVIQPTQFNLSVASTTQTNCGQNNGTICINTTGGIAPYTYQWNDPYTQTTSCADSLTAGCYYVNVIDAAGCSADSTICISDIPSATITLASVIDISCNGSGNGIITFNVMGGTTPYSSITWQTGAGNPMPSENGQTYADSLSGGTYSIQVTDAAGCISSLAQSVNEPSPVVAAITSTVQNNCFGQCSGQATVSAAGGTVPYSYLWNNAQTSPTATGLCATTYSVLISDANGCQKAVSVTITAPPQITLVSIVTNANCNGDCDGSVSVNVSGGTVPYNYAWSPNSSVNPSAFNLCAGTYNTTATDANGCVSSTNNTITEPPALAATFSTIDATCGTCNGEGTLSVSGGTTSYSYLWNNGQTNTTATGLCAGINPVTVTDANGCTANVNVNVLNQGGPQNVVVTSSPPSCAGSGNGTATVTSFTGGTPNFTYLWNTNPPQTDSTANSLNGGNYFVTITDANGCTAVQGVNITEPTPVQALGYVASDTICYGQSTQVWTTGSGGTGNYSYVWTGQSWFGSGPHTVNPTQNSSYCFSVTDEAGCVDSGCVTLNVLPPLALSISDDTLNICFGDDTVICADASGGDGLPYTYTWSNNIIDSVSSPSCQQVTPFITTNYVVTVSDGCSINAVDSVAVAVNPYPYPIFVTSPTADCPPFSVTFTSGNPGVPNATYSWDFNGDGIADDSQDDPVYTYNSSGSFTVSLTITSEYGCDSTYTVNNYITVYPVPDAGVDHTPETGTLINPDIDFITNGLTTGATNYFWDFGDEQTGEGANPNHIYGDTGTYYVTLITTNDFGCADTALDTVIIDSEFAIFVPNAFTPDANGKNDVFMAKGVGIDENRYEMYIFDRWGDQIWETHDMNKGWDGTANGGTKVVQQDVYVWLIICYDLHSNKHRLTGMVTLVR